VTIVVKPLGRVRVYEQPDASFKTDHSGTPGDYIDVPAVADTMQMTHPKDEKNPGVLQQYKHGASTRKFGPPRPTVSFEVPLAPTGTPADETTASLGPTTVGLFRLLDIVLGGSRSGNMGSTVDSAASASVFTVAAGEGTRFTAGGAVAWVNASGELEIQEVEAVATDEVTLKVAFSGTPDASDVIYNVTTFYPDDGGSSAQFIVEGAEASDRWSVWGAQSGLTFTNALNEIPRVGFNFTGAAFSSLGDGTLAAATYANYDPIVYGAGKFVAQVVGTATRAEPLIADFSLQLNLEYKDVTASNGLNGIYKKVQAHNDPFVQGSFTTYFEDLTWYTARDAETRYHLAFQLNTSGNQGVLLTVPNAQITMVAPPSDLNGLAGHVVSFVGGLDSDATDLTTALRRAPFRIHVAG
jgi:hypothetical protein